jgi:hypothetical protein
MKLLFENWRQYLNEDRGTRIETLEEFDLSPPAAKKLADNRFIRLSTYIANNYSRFGEEQIKDFEKRIFDIFFQGKRLKDKYPITGFEFEPDLSPELRDRAGYAGPGNGYMLLVDGSPFYGYNYPDEGGEYLDFDKDLT